MNGEFLKTIQLCEHCEEKVSKGTRFCNNCNTAEKRRLMDEENRKINGNPNWHKEH